MGIFASIISAAVPALVGGLFKKKEKQTTSGSIDYVKLRQNAEAAGFNPLTALRAGGGAGFQVTHHPVLAGSNFVAQALSDGLQAGFGYDPNQTRRAELETEIMQAQLARLNGGARPNYGLDPLAATGPNVKVYDGAPLTPEAKAPEITNPWPKYWGWKVSPDAPNVEAFEDRYGDLTGGLIGGVTVLGHDVAGGVKRNVWQPYANWANKNFDWLRF